jgi:hypothetical protein
MFPFPAGFRDLSHITRLRDRPSFPANRGAPQFVERPPAVETTTTADQPKPDAAKPVAAQTAKPTPKHYWSEARIVGELHRHGVYW